MVCVPLCRTSGLYTQRAVTENSVPKRDNLFLLASCKALRLNVRACSYHACTASNQTGDSIRKSTHAVPTSEVLPRLNL